MENIISANLEPSPSTQIKDRAGRTNVNLQIEKSLAHDNLTVNASGNDIFNIGTVENTFRARNAIVHQISAMAGLGLIFSTK